MVKQADDAMMVVSRFMVCCGLNYPLRCPDKGRLAPNNTRIPNVSGFLPRLAVTVTEGKGVHGFGGVKRISRSQISSAIRCAIAAT